MNNEIKYLVTLINNGYTIKQTQSKIYRRYGKWRSHDSIILTYIKYFNKIFKIKIIEGKMYLRNQ